jgi:preprotein translocase subunit SecF
MKKAIKFSRIFLPLSLASIAVIVSGIFGLQTVGINLGIDFQAGFIGKVRIAPPAVELTYTGSRSITVDQSATAVSLVMTGIGSDNETVRYPYTEYAVVGDFERAVSSIPGITVSVSAPASYPLSKLFTDSGSSVRLSARPFRFHYIPEGSAAIDSDDIREAIARFPSAAVQVLGNPENRAFQIRLRDDGTDPNASATLREGLSDALSDAFGKDNIALISTDFVGSRFSKTLASQAVWLVLGTLVLIMAYATIRFRWDFALGAILAIVHDALMMVAFIVWTQMEFNSLTIAALLTIIGYSINDTVVVFDRIRENMRLHPELNIVEHLDLSQTEVLSRTIITTVTTMLAVLSLFVFTTGDMKDFALALLVGMVSGVYSTIFIAGAFISFVSRFRKDGGRVREKAVAQKVSDGALV